MNPCECADTRQIVICAMNREDGPCLTTAAEAEPAAAPEPPALNSDALTASLMTALSSKITL